MGGGGLEGLQPPRPFQMAICGQNTSNIQAKNSDLIFFFGGGGGKRLRQYSGKRLQPLPARNWSHKHAYAYTKE